MINLAKPKVKVKPEVKPKKPLKHLSLEDTYLLIDKQSEKLEW